MKIGHAHVSTSDQAPALQQDALKAAGRTRIITNDTICRRKLLKKLDNL
jgi:hypothetical protein